MRRKLLLSFGFFGLLIVLLAVSVYVALKNQDIRQKAANDQEYMVVTEANRRNDNKAQFGVVLNKLDPKFQYRLVFDVTYTSNQTENGNKPPDRKKTISVHENKTYKFVFKTDCHSSAQVNIQLYYRETQQAWKLVDASTARGTTKLDYTCKQANPSPAENLSEGSAGATLTPSPENKKADEKVSDADGDAVDIDSLEDFDVLDRESKEAARIVPTPTSSATLSAQPSAVAIVSPITSPLMATQSTPTPPTTRPVSPTPQATLLPSPSSLATPFLTQPPATDSGGFGEILTQAASPAAQDLHPVAPFALKMKLQGIKSNNQKNMLIVFKKGSQRTNRIFIASGSATLFTSAATMSDMLPGNYDIYVSTEGYLTQEFANVHITPQTKILDLTDQSLLAGDVSPTNEVDIYDYSRMVADFNKHGKFISDISADDVVDIYDYSFLVANFGKRGKAP
jgi:hypothetical protein